MREWIEDIVAAVAIITLLVVGIWVAYGLGLPTGGDELMEVL